MYYVVADNDVLFDTKFKTRKDAEEYADHFLRDNYYEHDDDDKLVILKAVAEVKYDVKVLTKVEEINSDKN